MVEIAAGDQAARPDGDFPVIAVVGLAQAGQEQRVDGGLGGNGHPEIGLEAGDAVEDLAPVDGTGSDIAGRAQVFVFGFARMLVLPVVIDAAIDAGSDAGIDHGDFPPVAVIHLGGAGDNGRTQGQVARGERVAAGIAADEPADGEALDRVGDGRGVGLRSDAVVGTGRAHDRAAGCLPGYVVARAPELGTQAATDADQQQKGEKDAAHGRF